MIQEDVTIIIELELEKHITRLWSKLIHLKCIHRDWSGRISLHVFVLCVCRTDCDAERLWWRGIWAVHPTRWSDCAVAKPKHCAVTHGTHYVWDVWDKVNTDKFSVFCFGISVLIISFWCPGCSLTNEWKQGGTNSRRDVPHIHTHSGGEGTPVWHFSYKEERRTKSKPLTQNPPKCTASLHTRQSAKHGANNDLLCYCVIVNITVPRKLIFFINLNWTLALSFWLL